jgi:hypothetical protein
MHTQDCTPHFSCARTPHLLTWICFHMESGPWHKPEAVQLYV